MDYTFVIVAVVTSCVYFMTILVLGLVVATYAKKKVSLTLQYSCILFLII